MKKFIEVTEVLVFPKDDKNLTGYWNEEYGNKVKDGNYRRYNVVIFDIAKIIMNIDEIKVIESNYRYFNENTGNFMVKILDVKNHSFFIKESFEEIKKKFYNLNIELENNQTKEKESIL